MRSCTLLTCTQAYTYDSYTHTTTPELPPAETTNAYMQPEALDACGSQFPFCSSSNQGRFHNVANKRCRTPHDCDPKYAGENALEASYLWRHDSHHYLFGQFFAGWSSKHSHDFIS